MKKINAKVNARVIASYAPNYEETYDVVPFSYNEIDETKLVGVILDKPATAGNVWVKFIEGEYLESVENVELEFRIKDLILESEQYTLEEEFRKANKDIKNKILEAAKLIKEANSIAKTSHLGRLANIYAAIVPLINAMDDSGWRSSSWGC